MATILREEYDRLRAAAEDELVPADYAKRLIAGESPLRVWRELRGLSQVKLGAVSGINRVPIVDIEARRGKGSVDTVGQLADALGGEIGRASGGERGWR